MMLCFFVIYAIANIMMSLCIILAKKTLFDREKMSAFECGFDQKSSSRIPFSLRFFLITIIFLIFDVEIALILPAVSLLEFSPLYTSWLLVNTSFIIILIIGVLHEWAQGALEWSE